MSRAAKRSALLFLGSLLLLSGALGQLGSNWFGAPITAWGSGTLLSSRPDFQSLPAYQALQDLVGLALGDAPTSTLASLVNSAAAQDARPDAVVVFVGSQQAGAAATQQLQALASAAGSWLQLPNTVHQGQSSHVFKGLQQVASRVQLQVLGSCTGAPAVTPATPDTVRQHLAASSGGSGNGAPAVLVICADASGEDEAALLAAAAAALAARTDKYLMVHTTGTRQAAAVQAEQRRRLLGADSGNSTSGYVCGSKCKIQVKFLEGLIVFVTVALAVGIGFCCMHIINTPTRFETPKEARAAGHHD